MAWNDAGALTRAAVVLAATWIVYDVVMTTTGDRCVPALRRLVAGRRAVRQWSPAELDGISRLVSSTVLQAAFLCALVPLTGVRLWPLIADRFQPALVAYGVALGVGEMALASMLCFVAIRITTARSGRSQPYELDSWLSLTRAGWMRLFFRAAEVAPLPFVVLVSTLYIGVEEVVFRGVLVTFLRGLGPAVALVLPLVVFLAAQTFRMPSRESAMFPLVGASVVGVVHGALLLAVPNVVPLVVAHLAFFAFALL
jgi:hypothetical protein